LTPCSRLPPATPGRCSKVSTATIAIANAKLTYKKYQELFGGPRWKALAAKAHRPSGLLWASTSTKNPKYRDVLYVEELIGADTVDTIPPATFDAFP